ncbi:MAG: hypothetical protein LBO06_04715 [Bacteroidales bacterium]|jgi:hypothetical protein|nr:hypothetical protein [Bacteroidales bacterium]
MKQLVLLLLCVSVCSCIRVNPPYAGIEKLHPEYQLREMDFDRDEVYVKDTNISLYKMDKQVLQNVIAHSQKQYFLLYSFNIFCSNPNCLYYDTVVKQFYENTDVALLLVSSDNPLFKHSTEECFKDFGYPVFMLDPYRYGSERNLSSEYRFISFLSEINPSTKLEQTSNLFILFDKNMNALLEGYYDSDTKQQIMKLIQ